MPKVRGMGERWGAPALLALVVTVGMAAIYGPLLSNPADKKFYGYGDSWTYYGPTQFYGDYIVHQGDLPLWNPLILCGQPIAGNPQYANFYAPNVVRRLLTFSPTPFKTHVGMAIMLYAHILSAALGAYALARSLSLSRAGAFTAGIAFTFSAAFTQRIFGHLLVVMVISWLPWCLYCLRAVMHAPTLRAAAPAVVGLGATFSMAILAGTPQMTLLVGFTLLLYWIVARVPDALAAFREQRDARLLFGRRIGTDFLTGSIAVALAVGLSAPLVIPALQFFADTPRGTTSGEVFEKTVGDETFSAPELLAAYNGGANYEGLKTLSAVGLLLAIAGLFSPKRREAWTLAALAVLLIDASLERSLVMLHVLLALSPFPISSPARGMMVAMLPLALLVGMGVDVLRDAAVRRRGVLAGVASVLGLIICILLARRLSNFSPNMSPLVLLYPALAVAALVIALYTKKTRWIPAAVVALLIAEAVHWRGAYIRDLAASGTAFYTESPVPVPQGFWNGLNRDVWEKPNRPVYDLAAQINGFDAMPLNGVIATMMPGDEGNRFWRAALPEWMAATGNRGYLLLKRGFWLHSNYVEGEMPPAEVEFAPTTTAFLANAEGVTVPRVRANEVRKLPYSDQAQRMEAFPTPLVLASKTQPPADRPYAWRIAPEVPAAQHKVLALEIRSDCDAQLTMYRVYQNDSVTLLPINRLYIEPTPVRAGVFYVPLPDGENLTLAMSLTTIATGGTVSIEQAILLVDAADEAERIHVVSRTANAVEVEVRDLPAPRILSCIDFMYPGWHAYVDGKKVPLLRAFSYFKAVEVPAGTHRIVFRFSPYMLYHGFAAFAIAVIACAVLIWWARTPNSA